MYDRCTTLDSISAEQLRTYDLLVMLNAIPSVASRSKFEDYMGHGDECFTDATQNLLFTNAFQWIALLHESAINRFSASVSSR